MVNYVHYGSSSFDKSQFSPVHNEIFTKPSGGFWASPVNAPKTWKDFVINTKLERDLSVSFSFELTPQAKVLHLRQYEDLESLPKIDYGLPVDLLLLVFLDFEKLAEHYDAIEFHYSESIVNDFHLNSKLSPSPKYSLKRALDGWDCDSILIMNPNIIFADK